MNKLCKLLNLDEDQLFEKTTKSFRGHITTWEYFVNWDKVWRNIKPIEKELNLLNVLIGKENIQAEAVALIKEYPTVIKAFPILLAIRSNSIDVLLDTENFISHKFNFKHRELDDEEVKALAGYIIDSGLGEILKDKRIKNLVDYATGVEVGLDSNGRKNRGGTLMETLVEGYVKAACDELNIAYMPQATAKKIKAAWSIDIKVDKSSRIIDFAVNNNGKLYFIETNFYGGGGSKLKSTATEYVKMNEYWNAQGIEFIWATDGAGWLSTLKPLREYFDKADYLLNLDMLQQNMLQKIVKP